MRHRALVILLLLLLPAPAAGQADLARAVWVAYRCNNENECYRGTAFHVGNGVFYTNAHVAAERAGYGPLTLARGPELSEKLGTATVLCINRRALSGEMASAYDVAKVRLTGTSRLPALKTAIRGLIPGMTLTVIGYPGRAWTPVISTAVIEEIEEFDTFSIRLISGAAGPGSSGSPVLNERKEVIGILYGQASIGDLFFVTTLRFADRVCTPK